MVEGVKLDITPHLYSYSASTESFLAWDCVLFQENNEITFIISTILMLSKHFRNF